MSFHFSNIITILSRRFMKKNVPEETKTKKKKKSSKVTATTTATTKDDVEGPLSLSTSSSRNSNTDDSVLAATTAADVAAAVVSVPSLPYAQYVTLSPEEMKFHCQVRVMAHEVKYSMVTTVVNSWEQDLKVIPGWETIGGELLLRKMFELEPDCIRMFGFPLDTKYDDPALSHDEKFVKKGIALIVAVDIALSFLGPDLEPLEDQLVELGSRHVARQCKPRHWPMVGVALFYTLEQALGDKFTKEIQDCWVILYNFLGYHMIRGLIQKGGPTWEDN